MSDLLQLGYTDFSRLIDPFYDVAGHAFGEAALPPRPPESTSVDVRFTERSRRLYPFAPHVGTSMLVHGVEASPQGS